MLGTEREREGKKDSMTGEGERVRAREKHGGGRGKVCAMQCLHVKTNRAKGEPRVMLQEHSSGWGVGLYTNRWINQREECMPSAKCITGLLGHENVRCQWRATLSLLFLQSTMCWMYT